MAINRPTFLLGINQSREKIYTDLSIMPHLLIAGTTGCGKSVLLNQIINSIDSGIILIDPKLVEFTPLKENEKVFNNQVFSSENDITKILNQLINTMYDRYNYLNSHGFKNIYNADGRYTPITVFFDEYADVNATQKRKMIELLRLSRAAGIHFIIATQRPSRKIIDGDIKANITHRIAMKTATATDSRIIIDGFSGAVNLPQAQGYFYYSNGEKIQYLRSLLD